MLVGDGLLFENVKEQVRSLGLTDKVTFTGRQTNAYDYMMAMDIYLMPSHFEGFGIAAIEAEATGLMCYLSDHIPSDAVITENCITLSIDRDEDAKIWAEKIEKPRAINGLTVRMRYEKKAMTFLHRILMNWCEESK